MADIVVIAVLAVIVGLAALYVIKAKKNGRKCIGCPEGCRPSENGVCTACSCGCGSD